MTDIIQKFGILAGAIFLISYQAYAFPTPVDFYQDSSPLKALVFLSQSCPCSRSHAQHLNDLSSQYKDISFFGVITDPPESLKNQKVTLYYQNTFQFPVIFDPKQKLIKKFNPLKTPHVTLIASISTTPQILYEGGLSNKKVFKEDSKQFLGLNLKRLKDKKPLLYTKEKSFGCYIRRI